MIPQIILAWLYGHIFEYVAHKYFLHNHKTFKSIFKHHFGEHHKIARKNGMYDPAYNKVFSSRFEIYSLLAAAVIHLPVVFFLPWAYVTLILSLTSYYFIHRKTHVDVEWGKKWFPWHYDHHMGKDQHDWWGVRLPIIDLSVKGLALVRNKLFEKHI